MKQNNDLMSEKYQKTYKYLGYVEHLLILVSIITGCIQISAFASLVYVAVVITSSAVGVNICSIIAGTVRQKLIIKKKGKYDKIVLLVEDKLNTIEFVN